MLEAGYTYALTTFKIYTQLLQRFSLVVQDNRKPNDLNLRGLVSAVRRLAAMKANGNIVTIRFSLQYANGKTKNVISSIQKSLTDSI